MAKILNLHRLNTENIGDLMCAPYLYFEDLLGTKRREIMGFRSADEPFHAERVAYKEELTEADVVVIGGGGLLEIDFFKPFFDLAAEVRTRRQKWIIWGAGHNSWQVGDWRHLKQEYSFDRAQFDLLGLRDHNQPDTRWVPCVTCMHEKFDKRYPLTREIGIYAHAGTIKNPAFASRLPKDIDILDNSSDFEGAIDFLSGCELVLTDSFHGAYWATLLGRKVVAFPSSSKFYDLKHAVPLCAPEDWERYAKLSRTYDEALQECREANRLFADDVREIVASFADQDDEDDADDAPAADKDEGDKD